MYIEPNNFYWHNVMNAMLMGPEYIKSTKNMCQPN